MFFGFWDSQLIVLVFNICFESFLHCFLVFKLDITKTLWHEAKFVSYDSYQKHCSKRLKKFSYFFFVTNVRKIAYKKSASEVFFLVIWFGDMKMSVLKDFVIELRNCILNWFFFLVEDIAAYSLDMLKKLLCYCLGFMTQFYFAVCWKISKPDFFNLTNLLKIF